MMKKRVRIAIIALLLVPVVFSSCSGLLGNDDGEGADNSAGSDGDGSYQLRGIVQKGPYIQGTEITIRELDDNIIPTGRTFTTTTDDDTGSFSIPVEVESPYVEISASGYYFDEVKGQLSDGVLPLQALADLRDSSSVNLNILTHLQKGRLEYLISQGTTFDSAAEQARNEVIGIFNIDPPIGFRSTTLDITESGDSNGILLAISALFQGKRSVAELSELLSFVRTDIREDGTLDSRSSLQLLESSMGEVLVNEQTIRDNIVSRYENFGLQVNPPDFEHYVVSLNPQLNHGLGGSLNALPDNTSIPNVISVTGDDADYRSNPRSLTDIGGGVIMDNVTGLRWTQNVVSRSSTNDAVSYCEGLSTGGLEWRLPDILELVSIYDGENSTMPVQFEAGVSVAVSRTDFNGYSLRIGSNGQVSKSSTGGGNVFCVAGNSPAAQRKYFKESTNTVHDLGTDYMWQKTPQEDLTWTEAISYCEALELDGYTDWRLPDVVELFSMFDPAADPGGIYSGIFDVPSVYEESYWSSSPDTADGTHAWIVTFGGDDPLAMGNPGTGYSTDSAMSVRCMRED